tara:strand:+ start:643 stop:882 length:240 start_codon:yes stop_codon:yes gene_type:complete
MTTKYFYIINHYVPFPSSEYGGLWNVVAESDDECFDLIAENDNGYNQAYYPILRENIMKCQCFELNGNHKSSIVEQFTT